MVGLEEGFSVAGVGCSVGCFVGSRVGCAEGDKDGLDEGFFVGCLVVVLAIRQQSSWTPSLVGQQRPTKPNAWQPRLSAHTALGVVVCNTGELVVGFMVGLTVGFLLGLSVGSFMGLDVGFFVGLEVGDLVGWAV